MTDYEDLIDIFFNLLFNQYIATYVFVKKNLKISTINCRVDREGGATTCVRVTVFKTKQPPRVAVEFFSYLFFFYPKNKIIICFFFFYTVLLLAWSSSSSSSYRGGGRCGPHPPGSTIVMPPHRRTANDGHREDRRDTGTAATLLQSVLARRIRSFACTSSFSRSICRRRRVYVCFTCSK